MCFAGLDSREMSAYTGVWIFPRRSGRIRLKISSGLHIICRVLAGVLGIFNGQTSLARRFGRRRSSERSRQNHREESDREYEAMYETEYECGHHQLIMTKPASSEAHLLQTQQIASVPWDFIALLWSRIGGMFGECVATIAVFC